MSISKARSKYQKHSYAAFLPVLFFCLSACQTQAARQAELQRRGEEPVREADLRAFCPPVEFAEGAYAYNIYGKGARAAGGVSYQAAIADITRDCRYDHEKGLIYMQIAAAGRVVTGSGAGKGALSLPIAVKIARGDHIIFAKTYQKHVALGQTNNAATQFLFFEKVTVKKAEAVKGTKVTIGFAAAGNIAVGPKTAGQAAQRQNEGQKQPPKPHADRLSPKAGDIIIPESF